MADDALITDLLPEWPSFRDVVGARAPGHGTACAAWTTRDVITHQAGNAVELGRVLAAHLDRRPVPATRGFEEREAPFRALTDDDRLAALEHAIGDLCRVLERGLEEPAAWVPWTGRHMRVAWFGEHMRSELVLHRWDLVGDDDVSTRALAEPWMTTHSVEAVGLPLLRRGQRALDGKDVTGRIRAPGRPDVVLAGGSDPAIGLADPQGPADLVCDPSARVLLLWGRGPADCSRLRSDAGPERLGRLRTLLPGY